MGILQLHWELVHRHPGFCVHLWVVNRHSELQVVMVNSVELFLHAHNITDWTTRNIEPDSVLRHHPYRLDDERGIVQPLTHRVPIKSWLSNFLAYLNASIHQFGELPPVCPDHAPGLRLFIQDRYFVLVLKDLGLPQVIEIGAGETYRLALVPRIVIKRGEDLIGSD